MWSFTMNLLFYFAVSAEKLQALLLAESVMSVLGEHWLLEQSKLYDVHDTLPVDK